jgi:hypothetical protein
MAEASRRASHYMVMEHAEISELAATSKNTSFNVDTTLMGPFSKVGIVIVVTSASSAIFSVQPQVSADGKNYENDPDVSSTSITTNGTFFTKFVNHGSFGRIQFTCSTGSATFAVYTMRKSQ